MIISSDTVERTWQDVAGMSGAEAEKAMQRVAKDQGYLMAFVLATTESLRPDASELATYLFFVILRMFETECPKKIGMIKPAKIDACYDSNEAMLQRLENVHDKFFDRVARVEASRQPHIFMFLVE